MPQFLLKQQPLSRRTFHASSIRRDAGLPDHYATLGLDSTATAGDIKKSVYFFRPIYNTNNAITDSFSS